MKEDVDCDSDANQKESGLDWTSCLRGSATSTWNQRSLEDNSVTKAYRGYV